MDPDTARDENKNNDEKMEDQNQDEEVSEQTSSVDVGVEEKPNSGLKIVKVSSVPSVTADEAHIAKNGYIRDNEGEDPTEDGVKNVDDDRHVQIESDESNNSSSSTNVKIRQAMIGHNADRLDTYIHLLEKDTQAMNTLMEQKEKEWELILKLKHLKEIKLAKLRKKRSLANALGTSSTTEIHAEEIEIEKRNLKIRRRMEAEIEGSIVSFDKEVRELLQFTFPEMAEEGPVVSKVIDYEVGQDYAVKSAIAFSATMALKKIANQIYSTPELLFSSESPKIIGEGRQGPKLNVSSLIADYRTKTRENSEDKLPAMEMNPTNPYLKVFNKLSSQCEKEREMNNSSPPTTTTTTNQKTVQNTSTVPIKSKNSSASGSSKNGNASKTSGGSTTLAKLLSTNNGASRSLEDGFSFEHSSNLNSDKTLSLANLLASSKSRDRDDPQRKAAEALVPLCQGCQANKAQFVCAGCANQWYCSRECQVAAWDEHSELCAA